MNEDTARWGRQRHALEPTAPAVDTSWTRTRTRRLLGKHEQSNLMRRDQAAKRSGTCTSTVLACLVDRARTRK
jgi:hypothetical protein